jgi:hypothetical protein
MNRDGILQQKSSTKAEPFKFPFSRIAARTFAINPAAIKPSAIQRDMLELRCLTPPVLVRKVSWGTNISNMGHWQKFKLTHYPKRTIEDKIILLNVHSTWTCVFDFCCWNFAGTGKA